VHATGFHARVWDQVIRHLGERHVISVDQRGHGRSQKTEIRHWKVFGKDLAAFVRELDLRDVLGVGHSMGGHAMTEAAAAHPDRFRRLVLIDPVIASPGDYRDGGWMIAGLNGREYPTAKRKNRFASIDEMFERFRNRKPYAYFHPSALRDHCEYGLLPAPDGDGYVLACPPAIEASVYMTSRTNAAVYESIRAIEIPVLILREGPPSRAGCDGLRLFSQLAGARARVSRWPRGTPRGEHPLPTDGGARAGRPARHGERARRASSRRPTSSARFDER
jgi:pimeloyl-ACP methyl ester carboxylesterase